jgi:hypothetical protein
MSAGMPSVISALPGNRELVDDGATGLLVPAGDAAAAAAAMLRLVRDPALADRLGRAAADRFAERHQPHQMAAAHLALWERLLRAKGVDLGARGERRGVGGGRGVSVAVRGRACDRADLPDRPSSASSLKHARLRTIAVHIAARSPPAGR